MPRRRLEVCHCPCSSPCVPPRHVTSRVRLQWRRSTWNWCWGERRRSRRSLLRTRATITATDRWMPQTGSQCETKQSINLLSCMETASNVAVDFRVELHVFHPALYIPKTWNLIFINKNVKINQTFVIFS